MDPDDGPTNLVGRVVGSLDAVRAALLERGARRARLAVGGTAVADAITPWQHLTHDYLPNQRWLGELAELKRPV